jgi:hypothetical protein
LFSFLPFFIAQSFSPLRIDIPLDDEKYKKLMKEDCVVEEHVAFEISPVVPLIDTDYIFAYIFGELHVFSLNSVWM